jgi:hypothetical protein
MGWAHAAGGLALIAGLSLVAGFITQFRQRGYVGWLGLCFLFLAGAGFSSEPYPVLRNYLMVFAGICFLFSFVSAILHTRARLREIRERYLAHEAQMLASLEVELERRKQEIKTEHEHEHDSSDNLS